MMINVLFFIMFVVAAIQSTPSKFAIALIFAMHAFLHDMLFSAADGFFYYCSAALFECIAITILMCFDKNRRLAGGISCILTAMIAVNLFGYALWFFYLSPVVYNLMMALLYIYAIYLLTASRGISNARRGVNKLFWRRPGIFGDDNTLASNNIEKQSSL